MPTQVTCPVILPATCVVSPPNTKFAQRRAVGSELLGHDGGWSDAVLLQEFSHQLERRLAVSPWLNQDVQDFAFAVHGTPDVQLSAVDGDKRFVEMPPHVGPPSRVCATRRRGSARPKSIFCQTSTAGRLTQPLFENAFDHACLRAIVVIRRPLQRFFCFLVYSDAERGRFCGQAEVIAGCLCERRFRNGLRVPIRPRAHP